MEQARSPSAKYDNFPERFSSKLGVNWRSVFILQTEIHQHFWY